MGVCVNVFCIYIHTIIGCVSITCVCVCVCVIVSLCHTLAGVHNKDSSSSGKRDGTSRDKGRDRDRGDNKWNKDSSEDSREDRSDSE